MDNIVIERRHYITGGIALMIVMAMQPFALLFVQRYLATPLAEYVLGEQSGAPVAQVGRQIDMNNLKIRGNPNADIFLVEFSDYECTFCSRYHSTPKSIVNESNGKVAWIFKHNPLSQIHPNARNTAIASECIAKLGNNDLFWKFSDQMLENGQAQNQALYNAFAQANGINPTNLVACMKDPTMAKIVDDNNKEGETLGVNGTPNTFIAKKENGILKIFYSIEGAVPKSVVEAAIAKHR